MLCAAQEHWSPLHLENAPDPMSAKPRSSLGSLHMALTIGWDTLANQLELETLSICRYRVHVGHVPNELQCSED